MTEIREIAEDELGRWIVTVVLQSEVRDTR